MVEIYKSIKKNNLFLKLCNKEYLPIDDQIKKIHSDNNYACIYEINDKLLKKIELYEILFIEEEKNLMVRNLDYVPDDIIKNCECCNFFSSHKLKSKSLKRWKETNEILKEYKEIINTIK